jgi:hypothetical protein
VCLHPALYASLRFFTEWLQSLSGYANRYPGYAASSTASQPSERSSSLATSRVSSVSSVRSAVDGEIDYKKVRFFYFFARTMMFYFAASAV